MTPGQALARPPVAWGGHTTRTTTGRRGSFVRPMPVRQAKVHPKVALRRPPVPHRPSSYAPPALVMNVVKSLPVLGDVVSALSAIGNVLGLGSSLASVQCAPGNPDWPGCAIPGGSAAALVQAGVDPAKVPDVIDYATEHSGIGGGGSGGMRIYETR